MELFKLLGIIAVDNNGANREIDETTEAAEKSESKISAAFGKIGEVAGKVGKVVATGLAAGGAAVGALAKQALDSYGSYEQLIGGVETLYGAKYKTLQEYIEGTGASVEFATATFEQYQKREETVLANAANAYKTAGMSANEYMETVNGFAASLTASLGEYEWQAGNYADMIVTDMADNANKMGTSMESIQNAYSGFAKQNYTMLDNLKLGYGGTKEEMERLLSDAEKIAGFEAGSLNIESFADVADAIHIIQEEMGIYGTTAKEASSTIQGSLMSTKAAWQNLLTGFADSEQDLSLLVTNLVDSATTAANNIVPRIAQILTGISSALPQVMAVIASELPVLMEALLPGLVDGAVALVVGLAGMLPSLVTMLFSDLPYLLSNALYKSTNPVISTIGSFLLDIGEMWREVLQPAFSAVMDAFKKLGTAFKPVFQSLQNLIPASVQADGAMGLIRDVCFWLEEALYNVSDKIQLFAGYVSEYLPEAQALFANLWEGCKSIWENIGQPIFDLLKSTIETAVSVFSAKMPEIKNAVSQCFNFIKSVWRNILKPVFDGISNTIKNVIVPMVSYAFDSMKSLWASVGKPVFDTIVSIVGRVRDIFSQYMPQIRDFVQQCFDDIQSFWENNLKPCFDAIVTWIEEYIAPVVQWLADVFEEVFITYISAYVDNAFNFIVDLWNETLKPIFVGITDFLTGVFTGDWEQAFGGIQGIVEGAMNGIKNAIETAVNTAKDTINGLIEKINSVKVPEWLDDAPIIGGLFEDGHINIPTLATGGVLKKGEIGLLEGNGAEAVVPLDQNRAWISAVARDMDSSMGGKETVNVLNKILEAVNRTNDGQDELKDSFASMKIEMNNREFGRLVKAVN